MFSNNAMLVLVLENIGTKGTVTLVIAGICMLHHGVVQGSQQSRRTSHQLSQGWLYCSTLLIMKCYVLRHAYALTYDT